MNTKSFTFLPCRDCKARSQKKGFRNLVGRQYDGTGISAVKRGRLRWIQRRSNFIWPIRWNFLALHEPKEDGLYWSPRIGCDRSAEEETKIKKKMKKTTEKRRPGLPRQAPVEEPQKGGTLMAHPSILKRFKEKYGRGWHQAVQELMEDALWWIMLTTSNGPLYGRFFFGLYDYKTLHAFCV